MIQNRNKTEKSSTAPPPVGSDMEESDMRVVKDAAKPISVSTDETIVCHLYSRDNTWHDPDAQESKAFHTGTLTIRADSKLISKSGADITKMIEEGYELVDSNEKNDFLTLLSGSHLGIYSPKAPGLYPVQIKGQETSYLIPKEVIY